MNPGLADFLDSCRERVDRVLDQALLTPTGASNQLYEAMRYAVLNGGKRIRPALVYAAANTVGSINGDSDRIACAVEMIHAYSLVHDDLPAMDDDDLRRGKPTCHVAYNEATAILAGDGLQSLAFAQLTQTESLHPATVLQLVQTLADAAGPEGMVGGQADDLEAVASPIDVIRLETMHRKKTGALITASITMGALGTGVASPAQLAALANYGRAIGLAFQVQDDILDVESSTETLGKRQGADLARNKPTYTSLLGVDVARQKLHDLHRSSLSALAEFDQRATHLRAMANFIVQRNH